jgi:hypothetical protein
MFRCLEPTLHNELNDKCCLAGESNELQFYEIVIIILYYTCIEMFLYNIWIYLNNHISHNNQKKKKIKFCVKWSHQHRSSTTYGKIAWNLHDGSNLELKKMIWTGTKFCNYINIRPIIDWNMVLEEWLVIWGTTYPNGTRHIHYKP